MQIRYLIQEERMVLKLILSLMIVYFTAMIIYYVLFSIKNNRIVEMFAERKYDDIIQFTIRNKQFFRPAYYQYVLALTYFTIDDKSSFKELKSVMIDYNRGQKLVFCITVNLLWVAVLYMQKYIEEADKLFDNEERRISLLSPQKRIFVEHVFDMAKMVHSYYIDDYARAEGVYQKEENIMNNSIWAVLNYYMCKIYDKNNEREKISHIVELVNKRLIENNYYSYFDEWRFM